jgi:hypothetical protein
MLVDVVESLPQRKDSPAPATDDAGVDRALRSFSSAMDSDDSLFESEAPTPGVVGGVLCIGDFVLRLRSDLGSNRQMQFALVEKLAELLRAAGSAETLAARMCLTPQSAGAVLMLRLEANGNSAEQAKLRWGLGLAHVQQALLFASRHLRQQMRLPAN